MLKPRGKFTAADRVSCNGSENLRVRGPIYLNGSMHSNVYDLLGDCPFMDLE
jgi:hypothetical protein